MATEITNPNAKLTPGKRYLIYFRYSPLTPDVARKLSDAANIRATWLNRYAGSADVELEGTTVTQTGEFIALVRVKGTPLIAAVAPIVAIIAIITAGIVALVLIKAVLVDVGGGISDALRSVGTGLEAIGTGAGTGLQFGLPAAGIALGAFVFLTFFASLAATGRR